ncbi:MAG: amino acid adenylation domain-containing protein, partial [Gammaproteobacteria bacterium]|nr:amino acid adenylation domain-containing protein [Gammaproteobacteria bacterium]
MYMDRSLDMLASIIGVLKTGYTYLPLDPTYPADRLAFMLEDAQAAAVLTQRPLADTLPDQIEKVICVDEDDSEARDEPGRNPGRAVNPDDIAYVIYTSGSSGKPKGVQIPHKAIVNLLRAMSQEPGITGQDTLYSVTTLSFDISVLELLLPITTGARVVIADSAVVYDGRKLLAEIKASAATMMQATPATWRLLLDAGWRQKLPLKILCGGEALSPQLASRLIDKGESLWNLYGPTEATIWSTIFKIDTNIASGEAAVPIGRPISNTRVLILDKSLQLVPIGVAGELHIGGVGLARGYLNRPELTVEKFIADPFSDDPGARLYKTGDLARLREDGNIEFLGRIDQQVKLRGFRIELGEIESTLADHEAVREAAVVIREDEPGDQRLVSYVVADEFNAPSVTDLRALVRSKLPEYMLPSAFILLDRLPLTANGKLDRNALPIPEGERQSEETFVEPRSDLERQLVEIWLQVLKLERLGIHDNFFDLGGHSLLATQVVSRIRAQLGIELPLSEMFEHPTVAELAQVMESLPGAGADDAAYLIPAVDRSGELPLSFAQERLWFLDQLEPGNAFYNMPLVIRLQGELRVASLTKSLNLIVDRHETLRTRFSTRNGSPVQVIDEDSGFALLQEDLGTLPEETWDKELGFRIRQEAMQPFDLAHDFPVRARLLRLFERNHVLLFTMHHIISDGWSLGVLFRELGACYAAFSSGRQPELPALPVQYADFASWQRERLRGEALALQLDYWKHQLDGLSALDLPTDRPRPPVQTYNGAVARNSLPKKFEAELERFSQQHGVSLYMTLLAAFAGLLHRYSGQQDIVVGSPIANRNRAELEGLIGFFVNSLVMRTDVSGNPSFTELVERVKRTVLGAFDHQDLPFEKLVDEFQPDRDLSRNPLFQVMFALQNASTEKLELQGLTLEAGGNAIQVTRFDLEVHIWQRTDNFNINIIYNTDLFDEATINRLFSHYQALLEAMVAAPDMRIADAPMLSARERQQIVSDWNKSVTDYPRDQTVQSLFETQVAETPDAVAVEYDSEQLSYGELNERANRLAHYLQARGVGPEVMVGISIERSLEMVIGLLGILKAGGAYL